MPNFNWSEFGVIGGVLGVLFFILIKILAGVQSFISENQKQQAAERISWLSSLDKHNEALNKISNSLSEHDSRATERGRYIREEHEKMIENLEEQGKVLARINGI